MAVPDIKYVIPANNLTARKEGIATLEQIAAMTTPEFFEFQGRILNFRKYRRYDTALYKNSVAITPNDKYSLFTEGVGEQSTWINDASDTIKKSLVHTNMPKKGQWQPGEIAIIESMEAVVGFTAGKATTSADGIASQPAVTAFPTNIDVYLLQDVVGEQFNLGFYRGNKNLIVQGLIQDFPQAVGKSGAAGAHAGAFSQNTAFGVPNLMTRPQVIEGQEDFEIEIQPLAASLDMSTAARDIRVKVVLNTWEFLKEYS
jgi:hypothetical protein